MSLVILQPCGSADARKHYTETIEDDVNFDQISPFLSESDVSILSGIYPNGKLKVWGVTPGRNGQNAKKWERMAEGDVTLLAQKGKIFASAVTTHKTHNEELAQELWGLDPNGQTWEYVYFLDEVREQNIPYQQMNQVIGYKDNFVIQGFQVLDESKSQALLLAFDLESDVYFPSTPEDEVYDEIEKQETLDTKTKGRGRKEQQKLSEIHVKKKTPRICSICGSELPTDLLVAAHIKKRSECSLDEKKDLANVATAMCVLGCDSLFEKGYIGVQNGRVIQIKPTSTTNAQSHVSMLVGQNCMDWKVGNENYFDWHFKHHSSLL